MIRVYYQRHGLFRWISVRMALKKSTVIFGKISAQNFINVITNLFRFRRGKFVV